MTIMQLIIVDDSPELRESIEIYARATGWQVASSDGGTVPNLEQNLSTLVLLDYRLVNARPEDWLIQFQAKYPHLPAKIYLLSGVNLSEELRTFQRAHGIDGILTKPLDLNRLNILLGDRASTGKKDEERKLRGDELLVEAVKQLPLAVRVLDAVTLDPLYENPNAQACPLDNAARSRAIQALAYRLENEDQAQAGNVQWDADKQKWWRYQMFRAGDWCFLTEEWRPGGPPKLFTAFNWGQRMTSLAEILEGDYSITRLRFYRVARLYSEQSFLLQSAWERGGGFDPDKDAWLHNEVLDKDVQQDLFVNPWLISPVTSQDPRNNEWKIEWGDATHRAAVSVCKDRHPIGVLALDRRRDHLPLTAQHFARDEPWSTEINENDMQRMSGLLESYKSMLVEHAEDHIKECLGPWNEVLSKIIQEGIEKTEARPALMHILERLREHWEGGEQIRDLYLVRVHDDGLLEAWAGVGPICEGLRGQLFQADEPYSRALTATTVVHNFREWYERQPEVYLRRAEALFGKPSEPGSPPEALKGLGSCLGVPLKQGERTFAILAICVQRLYYFTEVRVKLLEETAVRLLPMFLWGLAESQRDWLRRALAHEYREPVNRLNQLFDRLPTAEERKQAEALLRFQSAIIKNLRFLGEEGAREKATPSAVDLKDVLVGIIDILLALYPAIQFEGIDKLPIYFVRTSEEGLYQILFNLLENACKFSLSSTPVHLSARQEGYRLRLEICNRASRPIPNRDKDRMWHPYQRGSDAPVEKGAGVGLAVVRRICQRLGMTCELTRPGTPNEPEICFELVMPMAESDQSGK